MKHKYNSSKRIVCDPKVKTTEVVAFYRWEEVDCPDCLRIAFRVSSKPTQRVILSRIRSLNFTMDAGIIK